MTEVIAVREIARDRRLDALHTHGKKITRRGARLAIVGIDESVGARYARIRKVQIGPCVAIQPFYHGSSLLLIALRDRYLRELRVQAAFTVSVWGPQRFILRLLRAPAQG